MKDFMNERHFLFSKKCNQTINTLFNKLLLWLSIVSNTYICTIYTGGLHTRWLHLNLWRLRASLIKSYSCLQEMGWLEMQEMNMDGHDGLSISKVNRIITNMYWIEPSITCLLFTSESESGTSLRSKSHALSYFFSGLYLVYLVSCIIQ